MSEASYLVELREAAPAAPERLHELVRSLPAAQPRRSPRLKPTLVAAVGGAIAVALGAAAIGGLSGSDERDSGAGATNRLSLAPTEKQPRGLRLIPDVTAGKAFAPQLGAKSRLQKQDVSMALRVKNLSASTQSAVRTTRRLGGFVANADYSTGTSSGNSRLTVRIPVQNLQKAIASFTQLGTILSQHISVADLQGGVDRLDKRIATERRAGNDAKAKQLLRRRDRKSTRLNSSHSLTSRMPSSA